MNLAIFNKVCRDFFPLSRRDFRVGLLSRDRFGGFQLLDRENEQLVKRVADAMKGGRYPSPSDARIVDDQLEKFHLNQRRKKLEVDDISPP